MLASVREKSLLCQKKFFYPQPRKLFLLMWVVSRKKKRSEISGLFFVCMVCTVVHFQTRSLLTL